VTGADRAALRGVHGGGIRQRRIRRDVVRGQVRDRAVRAAHQQPTRLGGVRTDHGVGLAVGHHPHRPTDRGAVRAGSRVDAQGPVVAPGLDDVAGPDQVAVAVGAEDLRADPSEGDQLRAQPPGELRGLGVGAHDQQRLAPGQGVREPPPAREILHLLEGPGA